VGRKKRKNKKHKKELSIDELAKTAKNEVVLKRYRTAIDLLKQLLKQDEKQEWRDLLAEAYQGRAQELVGKNMFDEALGVMRNLQSVCKTALPVDDYTRLLLGAGKYRQAVRTVCESDSGKTRASENTISLIAALALAESNEISQSLPPDHVISIDRHIVIEALQALSDKDDARCAEQLKNISFSSPYKDFRFFLSGLMAYYKNDKEEALARLQRVPESSVLKNLATALTQFIGNEHSPQQNHEFLNSNDVAQQFLLQLHGASDLKSTILEKIRAALRREDYLAIFIAIRKNLDLFNRDAVQRFCQSMLARDLSRENQFNSIFGALPTFDDMKISALYSERTNEPSDAIFYWRKCLEAINNKTFPDPAERKMAKALLLERLAIVKLSKEQMEDYEDDWDDEWGGGWDDDEEDVDYEEEEIAWVECMQESLKYDPTHKQAYQAIIAYYRSAGEKANLRKWQEAFLAQFPTDVDALLLAAQEAFERKAYKTALNTLDRLLEVDPINRKAVETKIHFHVTKARKHIKEKKYHLARHEFRQAAETEETKHRDGSVQIKWALMELLAGEEKTGKALLEQGKQLSGNHAGTLFLLDVESKRMEASPSYIRTELAQLKDMLAEQPASPEFAVKLVETFTPYLDVEYPRKYESELLLLLYLEKARKCQFDQPAFSAICEYFLQHSSDSSLFESYAAKAGKSFPGNPRFTFYHCYAKCGGSLIFLSEKDVERLMQAAEQAQKIGDLKTAEEIKQFIGSFFSFDNLFRGFSPFRRNRRRFYRQASNIPTSLKAINKQIKKLLGNTEENQNTRKDPKQGVLFEL
jgi:hypothetical protein